MGNWLWGYKYGTTTCPVCGQNEPLDARGRMGKHRRNVHQKPPTMSYAIRCVGSGRRPNKALSKRDLETGSGTGTGGVQ